MALGATRGNVVRTIATHAAMVVAGGLAAGAGLTLLASRAIAAILPQAHGSQGAQAAHLGAQHALVFLVLAVALFLIGLLAAMFPARRAASIEPMAALRME
jgi:ABC-type antimicrobial peptide transport system permease subunit